MALAMAALISIPLHAQGGADAASIAVMPQVVTAPSAVTEQPVLIAGTAPHLAAMPAAGERVIVTSSSDPVLPRFDARKTDDGLTVMERIEQYRRDATPFVIHDLERLELHRPRLGILLDDQDADGADQAAGVVIAAVTPGGPADEAGLQAADIITHLNGSSMAATGDKKPTDLLLDLLSGLDDGDTVEIDYLRDGKQQHTTATARSTGIIDFMLPGVHPDDESFAERLQVFGLPSTAGAWRLPLGWHDMELVSLNPELGEYFGTEQGVLVISVSDEHDLELKPGDVILDIGGRAVRSPSHAMRILRSYEPGEQLTVRIMRHQREQTITTEVPEQEQGSNFKYKFHFQPRLVN